MAIGKLTARMVERAKQPGYYGDGGNLYLQISKWGTKSWVFRFVIHGRLREMGLGSADTLTLIEAREKARECRKQRLDGLDPIIARGERRAEKGTGAQTFQQCAEAYMAAHKAAWKDNRSLEQWTQSLTTYVYPVFGSRPVQEIDVRLILFALEPIWGEKTVTASRVRGRIESILGWATARGFRHGDNPARWKGHLDNLLPQVSKIQKVEHHAALPYAEIPAFLADLRRLDEVGPIALEFAILTAARAGEVVGARWDDIKGDVWTIPGERMKAGREHRVPLSEPALKILKDLAAVRRDEFVFPGGKLGQPIGIRALYRSLHRLGRDDLTTHGFRSTFADWAAEQTDFPREVREMALAHQVSNQVEAAYRRGDLFDKRRQLATAWARYCDTPPAATILKFRKLGT